MLWIAFVVGCGGGLVVEPLVIETSASLQEITGDSEPYRWSAPALEVTSRYGNPILLELPQQHTRKDGWNVYLFDGEQAEGTGTTGSDDTWTGTGTTGAPGTGTGTGTGPSDEGQAPGGLTLMPGETRTSQVRLTVVPDEWADPGEGLYEVAPRPSLVVWECAESEADFETYGACTPPLEPTETVELEVLVDVY